MKQIFKTVTGLALSAAIFIGSAAVSALADTPPRNPAFLLGTLNITDGMESSKTGEYITRAEAVYYAIRVSGHGENVPAAAGYSFADVTAATAHANDIEYGVALGIIARDDEFSPDTPVLLQEFVKMIDAGLGYTAIANLTGGYPKGYMTISRRLDMLDGIGIGDTDPVPYSKLEKLLTNVLMSDYASLRSATEYTASSDENVLYKVFDVYKLNGTVVSNEYTSVKGGSGVGSGKLGIGDETFDVEPSLYAELAQMLGYRLNVWVRDDEDLGSDMIISYETDRNAEITEIYSEDFDSFENGVISYAPNGHSKTVKIPSSAVIIYNGRATSEPVPSDVFDGKWGTIRVVDPDGRGVSTVIITAYENYYVGGINRDDFAVYDNTTNNRSISFKDGNEISEYAYFRNKTGESMTFNDITVGSVLSVAANDDYYDVIVVKESVTGVLGGVEKVEGELPEIYIDNNHYKLAPEMNDSRIADIKTGNTYTFYLDAGGRVAAGVLVESLGSDMQWAYLIDIFSGNEDGEETVYFKLLTSVGNVVSLPNAERIKVDGKTYKDISSNSAKLAEIKDNFANSAYTAVRSQAVRIAVDDEGCVSAIDSARFNSGDENETDSVRQICDMSIQRRYRVSAMVFVPEVGFTGGTVIFSVPANMSEAVDKGDNDLYGIINSSAWSDGDMCSVEAYNRDAYSNVAEAIVSTTESSGVAVPINSQMYITVIKEVSTVVNADDEVVVQVTGLYNGQEQKWTLSEAYVGTVDTTKYKSVKNADASGIRIDKGDAMRFALNKDGEISDIQLLYDCSEKKYLTPNSGRPDDAYTTALEGDGRFEIGAANIYRHVDGFIISAINLDENVDDKTKNRYVITKLSNATRYYVVDASKKNIEVSIAASGAIKDWYNYGQDYSFALIQNYYSQGRTIVIYKFE